METIVPLMANRGRVQEISKDERKYLRYQTKLENHKTTRIPEKKQNEGCEGDFDSPDG